LRNARDHRAFRLSGYQPRHQIPRTLRPPARSSGQRVNRPSQGRSAISGPRCRRRVRSRCFRPRIPHGAAA